MINIALEPLALRRGGFSPPLSLLMPTFAFPYTPTNLAINLHSIWNAPLPILYRIPQLRRYTYTRALSMQSRSTSELLRTL